MTSIDKALALLKQTSYFGDANAAFLQELASKMVPVEVSDGHIFFEEGQEIHAILILEEGIVNRLKLSVEDQDKEDMRSSIRALAQHKRSATMEVHSVLVDKIYGRGKVTGLLHNFRPGSEAFATVVAAGSVKAWLIDGDDFRDVIASQPQFALDMMFSLSRELRDGHKSLRALIKRSCSSSHHGDDSSQGKRVCRVLCYDTTSWVSDGFGEAVRAFNESDEEDYTIQMDFTSERLSEKSATFAAGYDVVCLFVNDNANAAALRTLSLLGVSMIAMRCAGYDRVDTKAARAYGLTVARVPAYSPYAVAEMAIALLMTVNRKIHKASSRVRMANFTLDAGLMGMDIHGKTVGVMGTGRIGQILCDIMLGFGAKVICFDVSENEAVKEAGGVYVSKEECMAQADVLFLMMPLLPATRHTINMESLKLLKKGVILINTSRGGLIHTKALLKGLQNGVISGVGIDVYENEQDYFFQDWSARNIPDQDLVALLGNTNVILTAHQAFFTKEAVDKIVGTSIDNIANFYGKGLVGLAHPNNCIPAAPPLE